MVPFSTGTSTDVLGRLYAQKLGEALGQTIIVENKLGAGGTVAANFVAIPERLTLGVDGSYSRDELDIDYGGDSIEIGPGYETFWAYIPHFIHSPFYVYAYSFGQLLVFSLYKRFKEEGESFKPKYIALLAAGGSEAPMKILADAGVDPRKPEFWQGGFDVIRELVDKLESL